MIINSEKVKEFQQRFKKNRYLFAKSRNTFAILFQNPLVVGTDPRCFEGGGVEPIAMPGCVYVIGSIYCSRSSLLNLLLYSFAQAFVIELTF